MFYEKNYTQSNMNAANDELTVLAGALTPIANVSVENRT